MKTKPAKKRASRATELLAAARYALATLKVCRDDLEMGGNGGAGEDEEMCAEAKALTPAIDKLEAAIRKAEGRS